MIQAADGKVLAAGRAGGDFAIVRYNEDGSLDTTFGAGGKQTIDFGGYDAAASLVVQSDGKIVAAGVTYTLDGQGPGEFAVVRLNNDGSLDSTFGASGKQMIRFGSSDTCSGVSLQSDGKIIVAGTSLDPGTTRSEFAVARLNSDGSLDNTFGAAGEQKIDVGSGSNFAYALAVESDDKIVVAGISFQGGSYDFAMAGLNANGSLDRLQTINLSPGGDLAYAVAVQSDGKIILAGYTGSESDFAVVRLNNDFTSDLSFGANGKQMIDMGSHLDTAAAVAVQSDGKIIVAGTSYRTTGQVFAVARLNSDGSLDNTFGADGKQTIDFGSTHAVDNAVAVQTDGTILVAGFAFQGSSQLFAVARLLGVATMELSSSVNPSPYGQAVTFTATVSSSTGIPAGTVKFFDGSTLVDTETLAGGTAQFTTSALAAVNHTITAVYINDANSVSHTVAFTQTVVNTVTVLNSSGNPSESGQAVTFTATVSGGGGTPTGTITFLDKYTVLATESLAGGEAQYTTSSLVAGDHEITVVHSGSVSQGYTSSTDTRIQTVKKLYQTINFGSLADGTYNGDPFNLSAAASSGQSVSLAVLSGPATLSGRTLTITGTGTVVIEASQAGNGNYYAAPVVDRSFTITQLTRAGRLDPTFGFGGRQIIDFSELNFV